MSATLLELRTRARIRADQDASTFPTDTQYNYLINEALMDVWYDLVGAGWPQSHYENTISLPGSQVLTPAPTTVNIHMVKFMAYRQGAGASWVELKRLPEDRRADMMSAATGIPVYYDLRRDPYGGLGAVLFDLFPTANSGQVYIQFIQEPSTLTSDTHTWYGPGRSDELIVLRAAMKACRKEGNDQGANFLNQEYQELWEKVIRMATFFDMRNAQTIRDVGPLAPRKDSFDYDV